MTAQIDYRPDLVACLRDSRRKLGATSPQAFAEVYLKHHFKLSPSRMHTELFEMLTRASQSRSQRLAVAAPRGHAKSTVVSLAYLLWCALYRKEMYIVLVSATKEQAVQLLKTVKHELQTNPLLIEDFPSECHPPGSKPAPKPWRDNQIVLRNGICIRALGANQAVRGMKHNQHRPSLIVVDDLENQEQAESAEQRDKLRDWFSKTLLKCGTPETNVIVVGTIIHYDSLLANLTDERPGRGKGQGWESRKYQAIESFSKNPNLWEQYEAVYFGREQHKDKVGPKAAQRFFKANRRQMLAGTRVLWAELEDYEQLMIMRAVEGRLSFQSEKQNDPLDPDTCVFSENSFRYWDDEHPEVQDLLASLGHNAEFYGACDPSLGGHTRRGDYTAIITLVRDRNTKVMYVIGAEIARRKPNQIIENIIQLGRSYDFRKFLVESNQFQEVLANQLESRARAAGVRLRTEKLTNTTNKQARIESLESLIAQGTLRFCRRHQLLLEQLRQYPMGAHDDGPDALQMAVEAAHRKRYITEVIAY